MSRLDAAVIAQGFAPSRARAKALIQNGQILVNGTVCTKPAYAVAESDTIALEGSDIPFVGRGGLKLAHALQAAQLSLEGIVCLDVGASTGGFTDCMLQQGAEKVYAVDVGRGQLRESLRQNPRVVSMEETDVRQLTAARLQPLPSFFTVDVSFISLGHVLPAVVSLTEPGSSGVLLIKPQFEAGREHIGKNGLVSSRKVHEQVLFRMLQLFASLELSVQLLCPSPIAGGSGNLEYLAVVRHKAPCGAVPDVPAVVEQAFAEMSGKKGRK